MWTFSSFLGCLSFPVPSPSLRYLLEDTKIRNAASGGSSAVLQAVPACSVCCLGCIPIASSASGPKAGSHLWDVALTLSVIQA